MGEDYKIQLGKIMEKLDNVVKDVSEMGARWREDIAGINKTMQAGFDNIDEKFNGLDSKYVRQEEFDSYRRWFWILLPAAAVAVVTAVVALVLK